MVHSQHSLVGPVGVSSGVEVRHVEVVGGIQCLATLALRPSAPGGHPLHAVHTWLFASRPTGDSFSSGKTQSLLKMDFT